MNRPYQLQKSRCRNDSFKKNKKLCIDIVYVLSFHLFAWPFSFSLAFSPHSYRTLFYETDVNKTRRLRFRKADKSGLFPTTCCPKWELGVGDLILLAILNPTVRGGVFTLKMSSGPQRIILGPEPYIQPSAGNSWAGTIYSAHSHSCKSSYDICRDKTPLQATISTMCSNKMFNIAFQQVTAIVTHAISTNTGAE